MPRTARWPWIAAVTIAVIAAVGYGVAQVWWGYFARPVIRNSWSVPLPGGGSVRYVNRSPRVRSFGPADRENIWTWEKADGTVRSYPISNIAGGYRELELRLRSDGQAVWLVAVGERVVATLDLQTGKYTGEGVGDDAQSTPGVPGVGPPSWATMSGGRALARRRF